MEEKYAKYGKKIQKKKFKNKKKRTVIDIWHFLGISMIYSFLYYWIINN